MYPEHCMILPIAYTLRYLVKCLSLQKHGFAKCAVINMQWNAFQKMCFESVRIYFVENGKEVPAISSTWASLNPLDKKKKTATIRGVWTCCGCHRPPLHFRNILLCPWMCTMLNGKLYAANIATVKDKCRWKPIFSGALFSSKEVQLFQLRLKQFQVSNNCVRTAFCREKEIRNQSASEMHVSNVPLIPDFHLFCSEWNY